MAEQKFPVIKTLSNKYQNVMFLVNSLLLSIGFSISTYQTGVLLKLFVEQPTVLKIIPLAKREIPRPLITICKNLYQSYVDSRFRIFNKTDLLMLAAVANDQGTMIDEKYTHIFHNPGNLDNSPYLQWEADLTEMAGLYRNCSSMFRRCTTLMNGFSKNTGFNCCSSARQLVTLNSICYTVKNVENQRQEDRFNAAVYEVWFPSVEDNKYSVYVTADDRPITTDELPTTIMGKNVEVSISIQLKVVDRLNDTEKCSNEKLVIWPYCRNALVSRMVEDICNCSDDFPFWAKDAKLHSFFNQERPRLRPCRLLEGWVCTKFHRRQFRKEYQKLVKLRCFNRMCKETKLSTISVTSLELSPVFNQRLRNESNGRMSFLYVYYGSLTIIVEKEEKGFSWTFIVSSLGGIWGLWLGWSIYDVLKLVLVFAMNGSKQIGPGRLKAVAR